MARVTVEDCVTVVPNRFELVALASQRARNIAAGAALTVERDNDKNAVIALREIAEGTVDTDYLREAVIQSAQRRVKVETLEEEVLTETEMKEPDAIAQELESFEQHNFDEGESLSFSVDNLDVED